MSINHDVDQDREPQLDLSSGKLLRLSVISAAVYLLLALLLFHFFHDAGLTGAFQHGYTAPVQLLTSLLAGCVAAAVIGFIITTPPVSEILDDFYIVKIISQANLNTFDRIHLSIFAGVGEEILFRGAIQPLIGIWLTSIIFVGLHGYFKFNTLGHFIYSVMMFGLSVGLGYTFEYAGLIAAMSAHAVYDIVMLQLVQRK